jgi:transporter family-2 protein
MYQALSVLTGILITVMVTINGELTGIYGVYSATVIIHAVGLTLITLLVAIKRKSLRPANKLPFYYYLGGFVGVGTVVFNNMAFGYISVSAMLALSLLGSILTSLVIDQFGLFRMARYPFTARKLPGIVLVCVGIAWMLWPFDARIVVPVVVSLLTGVTIVVSRSLNACLTQQTGVLQGTFFNYAVGLTVSAVILLAVGRGEPMLAHFSLSPRVYIYTGGMLGVCTVTLFNAASSKISSFYITLLSFAGQVFSGIAMDALLSGSFSLLNLIGGVFVTAGLTQNLWTDKKIRAAAPCPCPDVEPEEKGDES